MPSGGRIPYNNKPIQAPGIGKTAKRHDLEFRNVPRMHDDRSMQYGDAAALEAQYSARPIRTQPSAQPKAATGRPLRRRTRPGAMEVPDPIEFAAGRLGGQVPMPGGAREVDLSGWLPLLQRLATVPNSGGGLTSGLLELLAAARRRPLTSSANLIDLDELDRALGS